MNKEFKPTLCKYWNGWLDPDAEYDTMYGWYKKALEKKNQERPSQLIIFEIPKGPLGDDAILEIEKLLQQKFGA